MHVQVPDEAAEELDQRKFDEDVEKKGKVVLEWLAGAGIVAALLMSVVALVKSGEGKSSAETVVTQTVPASAATAVAPVASKVVSLEVIGGYKLGPDKKKHDAFTVTNFAAKVGQPLTLKINNTDNVAHSITAPVAGVNITVKPGTHTYTLLVKQAGKFQWYCVIPCDTDANGWAMQNAGYMSGYITAT
jgi:heme/copper-type cytochrome/quinol oxidase subunit 2